MEPVPSPIRSVYVHAPFCARRCPYCDFAVQVRRVGDLPGWRAALEGELRTLAAEGRFPLAASLDTLYVGGGTPSLLGAGAMTVLAALIGPERLRGGDLEWTAEANPESFTPEVAAGWRAAGVNRVSLGVQSFHEPALRWMGRLHGPDGARQAVATARAAGLAELSVDLIFALPDETGRELGRGSGRGPRARAPTRQPVRAHRGGGHPARAERSGGKGAPGLRRALPGGVPERRRAAERGGLSPLRSVQLRAARPRVPPQPRLLGGWRVPGAGQWSAQLLRALCRWNLRDWDEYARAARAGRLPVAGQEEVVGESRRLERVWLALRTDRGVAREELGPGARRLSQRWLARGLARSDADRVRLTAEGWLLLDQLAVELAGALEERGPEPARA